MSGHSETDYVDFWDGDLEEDHQTESGSVELVANDHRATRTQPHEYFEGKDFTCLNFAEMMHMKFKSIDEAERFYNTYAKGVGFSIRREGGKTRRGIRRTKLWVCSKEGQKKTVRDKNSIHKSCRPITRVGCLARFRIQLDMKKNEWVVSQFDVDHCHELIPAPHRVFLRSHRHVNDGAVDQAVAMKSSGIRTCEVHKLLANEAGGGHNLGYTKTDLYNKLYRHSRSRICDGDANAVLMYMDGLRQSEKSFVYSFTKDEEDRLDKLFWTDSKAVMDYAVFGDVIAFDTTYKKNTYNMPLVCIVGVNNHNQTIVYGFALVSNEREETFTWVLEEFVKAMGKKRPVSVVTDGDRAMQRAIHAVLPAARHRLCVWHLARNANSNIPNPKFIREFVGCMLRWCTTEEFDRAWWAMISKFDLYENP